MNSDLALRRGITRFAIGWTFIILFAFLLLGGGLILATTQLNAMARRLFTDAASLDTDHVLELTILAQHRADLLWYTTGDDRYREARNNQLAEVDRSISDLWVNVTSSEEKALVEAVVVQYQAFRQAAATDSPQDPERLLPLVDSLLEAIHRHRDLNARQMADTLSLSTMLNEWVDATSLTLILLTAVVLGVGGLRLWSRIFKPIALLSQAAAAFGQGDLRARAPLFHNDELGALARTFNAMADAICERERDRLDFVAAVAHDLKNSFVGISGAAQLLRNPTLRRETSTQCLRLMRASVQQMEAVIEDLLDAVQTETGRLTLRFAAVDLTALVTMVVRTQAEVTQSHMLRVEGEAGCLILADQSRLERVISNLLSNAIKYSPNAHEIMVNVAARGENAILSVQDHGVGMTPEELQRLFRPFARLARTRDMARGTGLGLVSVKKVVEAHGGSISITSALDAGTRVEVCLPLIGGASSREDDPDVTTNYS